MYFEGTSGQDTSFVLQRRSLLSSKPVTEACTRRGTSVYKKITINGMPFASRQTSKLEGNERWSSRAWCKNLGIFGPLNVSISVGLYSKICTQLCNTGMCLFRRDGDMNWNIQLSYYIESVLALRQVSADLHDVGRQQTSPLRSLICLWYQYVKSLTAPWLASRSRCCTLPSWGVFIGIVALPCTSMHLLLELLEERMIIAGYEEMIAIWCEGHFSCTVHDS